MPRPLTSDCLILSPNQASNMSRSVKSRRPILGIRSAPKERILQGPIVGIVARAAYGYALFAVDDAGSAGSFDAWAKR